MDVFILLAGFVLIFVFLTLFPVLIRCFSLWLRAYLSDAHVSYASLIGMLFRKVNPGIIVNTYILATKAGLRINTKDLVAHYLAGGNVERVVTALITAKEANIYLSFEGATNADLDGRDVLEDILMKAKQKGYGVHHLHAPDAVEVSDF